MNGPVAIILAAGQGKRMKSAKAKVLHEVCGQPMIHYVVNAARGAGAKTIVVVVGYARRSGPHLTWQTSPTSSSPLRPSSLEPATPPRLAGPFWATIEAP